MGLPVPLWQTAVRLVEDKQQKRVIGMDVRVPADSGPLTGAKKFYPSIYLEINPASLFFFFVGNKTSNSATERLQSGPSCAKTTEII